MRATLKRPEPLSNQQSPTALAPPAPSLQVTGTSLSAARQTAGNGTQTLGLSRIPANDQLVQQQIQAIRDEGLRAVQNCDDAWITVVGRERRKAASDLAAANSERDKLLSMVADLQKKDVEKAETIKELRKKEADAADRAEQNEEWAEELMVEAGWTKGSDGTWDPPRQPSPRPPVSVGSQDARDAAGAAMNETAGLPTADQRAGLTPYEPGPNVVALPPAAPAASARTAAPAVPTQHPAAPAAPAQRPAAQPQHCGCSTTAGATSDSQCSGVSVG